jgi:hypothetical protein
MQHIPGTGKLYLSLEIRLVVAIILDGFDDFLSVSERQVVFEKWAGEGGFGPSFVDTGTARHYLR